MARLIGKDVTVLDAGGDVLATYRSCLIEVGREMVDVSAVQDAAKQRRETQYWWRVRFSKIKSNAAQYPSSIVSGGTASFSCTEAATGKQYSGVILFSRVVCDVGGDPQMEEVICEGTGPLKVI